MTRKQNGFSLMESLVAVVVLSIGLLGLGRLQAGLWRSAGQLHARSEAHLLAVSNLERALYAAPASASAQQHRLSPGGSGYTVFESRLQTASKGMVMEMLSSVRWQDSDDINTLKLLTASYRPDAGDLRWLLSRE